MNWTTAILLSANVFVQRPDTIVKVAGAPVHRGIATLTQEINIGSVDARDEYLFGHISHIAVGADGATYVFDYKAMQLRAFDANGKFVRNIGRRGSGPGEYTSSSGIAVGRDGRVYQWDTGNWRINVYSPAGQSIATWGSDKGITGSGTANSSGRTMFIDSDGRIVFSASVRDKSRPVATQQGTTSPPVVAYRWGWVRVAPSGTIVDTVWRPAPVRAVHVATANTPNGRGSRTVGLPFDYSEVWELSAAGYVLSGTPSRYAFEIAWPGKAVVSVRRGVPPVTVSSAERAEARRSVETQMRAVDPGWKWGALDIAKTKPAYAWLIPADDGRVWVAHVSAQILGSGSSGVATSVRTDVPPPPPSRYDVFEADGTFLGVLEVPANVSPEIMRGDTVWGIATDGDDVEYVRRYHITWR